jgi:hypothetical protein
MRALLIQPQPHQAGEMARTGHSSAHRPQSTHLSESIVYFSAPSLIALCGQLASQLPHLVHSSEIMYAMIYSPLSVNPSTSPLEMNVLSEPKTHLKNKFF